ncbi:MAG: hypothetical protein MHM6MM_008712 [Cercozoa sp. M6MM]
MGALGGRLGSVVGDVVRTTRGVLMLKKSEDEDEKEEDNSELKAQRQREEEEERDTRAKWETLSASHQRKFERYLAVLQVNGFFAACEPGTREHERRSFLAERQFREKLEQRLGWEQRRERERWGTDYMRVGEDELLQRFLASSLDDLLLNRGVGVPRGDDRWHVVFSDTCEYCCPAGDDGATHMEQCLLLLCQKQEEAFLLVMPPLVHRFIVAISSSTVCLRDVAAVLYSKEESLAETLKINGSTHRKRTQPKHVARGDSFAALPSDTTQSVTLLPRGYAHLRRYVAADQLRPEHSEYQQEFDHLLRFELAATRANELRHLAMQLGSGVASQEVPFSLLPT